MDEIKEQALFDFYLKDHLAECHTKMIWGNTGEIPKPSWGEHLWDVKKQA